MQGLIANTSERNGTQGNTDARSTVRDTAERGDKKFHPVWKDRNGWNMEGRGERVAKVYWRCGSFYARVVDPKTERECWRRSPDGTWQGARMLVKDAAGARSVAAQQRYHDALEATKTRKEGWTVGDVLKAYPAAASAQRAATGSPTALSQASVVGRARRVFAGHEDEPAIKAPDILYDWAVDYNRRNGGGEPTETAASTFQQVRSVFSAWALAAYERNGMPRLDLRWRPVARPAFQYELPPKDLRERTIAAGKAELANGSAVGRAFLAEFFCAMSAADAARARWDWLGDDGVVRYKRHKTGKAATPRLAPEVAARWRELAAQEGAGEYVMDGSTDGTRHHFLMHELAAWMTELGWTTEKKGHELRKLMCSIWYTQVGAEWTQAWSGDSLAVLQKHYARLLPERAPAAPSV